MRRRTRDVKLHTHFKRTSVTSDASLSGERDVYCFLVIFSLYKFRSHFSTKPESNAENGRNEGRVARFFLLRFVPLAGATGDYANIDYYVNANGVPDKSLTRRHVCWSQRIPRVKVPGEETRRLRSIECRSTFN